MNVHPGLIALGLIAATLAVGLTGVGVFDLHPCGRGQSATSGGCSSADTLLLFVVVVAMFLLTTGTAVLLERRGVIRVTGRR